jgi:hypothetical protein
MSPQVQTIINEAEELSPTEQIELIAAVSQLLQKRYTQLSKNNDFWKPKTLEQLVEEQQIKAVKNLSDLRTDFWPEEESVDEFNEFIYQQRQEDRLSD